MIYGGDGPDRIRGGAGTDTIYGNDGNDVIAVGYDKAADLVRCGAGWDKVYAGANDVVGPSCERGHPRRQLIARPIGRGRARGRPVSCCVSAVLRTFQISSTGHWRAQSYGAQS